MYSHKSGKKEKRRVLFQLTPIITLHTQCVTKSWKKDETRNARVRVTYSDAQGCQSGIKNVLIRPSHESKNTRDFELCLTYNHEWQPAPGDKGTRFLNVNLAETSFKNRTRASCYPGTLTLLLGRRYDIKRRTAINPSVLSNTQTEWGKPSSPFRWAE